MPPKRECKQTGQETSSNEDVHCTCRRPHDNKFMVECKVCKQWFHGECVGVFKPHGLNWSNVIWYCQECIKNVQMQFTATAKKCLKLEQANWTLLNDKLNLQNSKSALLEEYNSHVVDCRHFQEKLKEAQDLSLQLQDVKSQNELLELKMSEVGKKMEDSVKKLQEKLDESTELKEVKAQCAVLELKMRKVGKKREHSHVTTALKKLGETFPVMGKLDRERGIQPLNSSNETSSKRKLSSDEFSDDDDFQVKSQQKFKEWRQAALT